MRNLFVIGLSLLMIGCGSREVKWDATGVFDATEVVISAETSGVIDELHVAEGERVDSGKVLGYIDTTQLELSRQALLLNRSSVSNRRQDITKQIAATQQQIKWQSQEKQRFEKLLSSNAATQKQVDDINNQLAVLQKQLAAQLSTLENNNRGVTDDSNSIAVQIAQIADRLHKSYIRSPITGNVLVKYAEQDEFASVGKPLFAVADMQNVFLRAYITADLLTRMKVGQRVKVYSDFGAKDQREYDGVVMWIADKAEFTPKTIQTRNERANLVYQVKVAVRNDGYLKIGMYGQMRIE